MMLKGRPSSTWRRAFACGHPAKAIDGCLVTFAAVDGESRNGQERQTVGEIELCAKLEQFRKKPAEHRRLLIDVLTPQPRIYPVMHAVTVGRLGPDKRAFRE